MLSIRLSRVGKKNKPMYRIAIMEKARDPYGRALEILGSYNPHSKELKTKTDRINHWIKNGAQMTPTVNNLLVGQGIIKGDKVKASIARKKKKGGKEEKKASSSAKATDDKPAEPKTEVTAEKTEEKLVETKPIAEEKIEESASA
jgi:small subunit ribosomal protein S16